MQPQPIMPTQQQLHEIYEENLRLREEVKGSADAAARNQYLEVKNWQNHLKYSPKKSPDKITL